MVVGLRDTHKVTMKVITNYIMKLLNVDSNTEELIYIVSRLFQRIERLPMLLSLCHDTYGYQQTRQGSGEW